MINIKLTLLTFSVGMIDIAPLFGSVLRGLLRQPRWDIDGKLVMVEKTRFWVDQWFGSSSMAIQFWEVYSIINEQDKTVREAWDGYNLMFTFRRTIDSRIMNHWFEVVHIASRLQFVDEKGCHYMIIKFIW
jgi:hypothetical protein